LPIVYISQEFFDEDLLLLHWRTPRALLSRQRTSVLLNYYYALICPFTSVGPSSVMGNVEIDIDRARSIIEAQNIRVNHFLNLVLLSGVIVWFCLLGCLLYMWMRFSRYLLSYGEVLPVSVFVNCDLLKMASVSKFRYLK
jgi:hypothetical protein